jgi:hypothetical protein
MSAPYERGEVEPRRLLGARDSEMAERSLMSRDQAQAVLENV